MFRSFALITAASLIGLAGCSAAEEDDGGETSESELRRRVDAAWFYDGPLPALEEANVTVSLKGNTARVSGYLPAGVSLRSLPHARTFDEGYRTRVELVYPIATARPGKSNSRPGQYEFQMAKPYRPDGLAITVQEGEHFVPWGGYPFVAYNGGIAFHGPITAQDPSRTPGVAGDDIWFLQRGPVSGGCNRMMAEHIVEFTHVIGVSMRKVYTANKAYPPNTDTTVNVISGYDMLDGQYVDVDYPTHTGAVRPASVYGAENVTMFGSWVATETPNGSDHPSSMKWEGGVPGKYYVFREHAKTNQVCAVDKVDMSKLKTFAASLPNAELPKGFCAKKTCIVQALRAGQNARSTCGI